MGNVYSLLCPGMSPAMFIPGLRGCGKPGASQRVRPRRAMVYTSPYGSCNNIVVKIIDHDDDGDDSEGDNNDEGGEDVVDYFGPPSGQISAHSSPPKTPTDGLQRTGSIYAMRDFTEAARHMKEQRERELERSRENLQAAAGDNNNTGEPVQHLKPTALQKVVRVIKVSPCCTCRDNKKARSGQWLQN